jgi:hypothetical protein
VPPALFRALFPEPEPCSVVSEFFAKTCLELFRAHVSSEQSDSDDDDDDQEGSLDYAGFARGTSATSPVLSPGRRGAPGSELGTASGERGSSVAPPALDGQGEEESSTLWRGLLSRIGSSHIAGVPASIPMASQAINFGMSPPSSTLNMDRMAYMRLSEKFEGFKSAAAIKDTPFSGDVALLATQKLRTDAWDLLARSYRLLAKSSHTHSQAVRDVAPFDFVQRHTPQVAYLSGQALAHIASLLGPFKQYVGALAKTVEATAAQSCLEVGAEEAIRQLLRAIGMYIQSAQRIVRSERKIKKRLGEDPAGHTAGAPGRFSASPSPFSLANESLVNIDEPFGATY